MYVIIQMSPPLQSKYGLLQWPSAYTISMLSSSTVGRCAEALKRYIAAPVKVVQRNCQTLGAAELSITRWREVNQGIGELSTSLSIAVNLSITRWRAVNHSLASCRPVCRSPSICQSLVGELSITRWRAVDQSVDRRQSVNHSLASCQSFVGELSTSLSIAVNLSITRQSIRQGMIGL